MAIKFFNIRSKETVVAETEPQISAMWASSDRSPNITQGQDFGWRMAPEVVVELKKIKANTQKLLEIASMYNVMLQDVDEKLILQYISDQTDAADAPIAEEGDYTDEYEQQIRDLELADRERAIAEREAALGLTPETTTTTTEAPTTTTTTTKAAPTTTTTTTKAR